jgi:hypothetical protein
VYGRERDRHRDDWTAQLARANERRFNARFAALAFVLETDVYKESGMSNATVRAFVPPAVTSLSTSPVL